MRTLMLVCCLTFSALSHPATADGCDAARQEAINRIKETQVKLEAALVPYEVAVRSGNLAAFEALAEATVAPWHNLLATIANEHKHLTTLRCPRDRIPNDFTLPEGWDMVRDIGAMQVIEIDRSITVLNHQAWMGRHRPTHASAD